MYYGELKEHSEDYQFGHATGVRRAYDDCIHHFQKYLQDELEQGHFKMWCTCEIIACLSELKHEYVAYCEDYGMGNI